MRGATGRFLPVDGLRGVAAVSVLVFHLVASSAQADVLRGAVPAVVLDPVEYLRSGVAIFFVISGFVIAHTTRNLGYRPQDAIRFSVRRQVRLDPPYYVAIALVLAKTLAERLVPGLDYQSYGPGDVVANMFYLQGFTHSPSVLAVAWTLCYEVQFYLFVVLAMVAAGRLVRAGVADDEARRQRLVRGALVATGLVSLALPFLHVDAGPWFVGSWWMFCLGSVVYWSTSGRVPVWWGAAALAVVGAWAVAEHLAGVGDPWFGEPFAWATALVIFVLARRGLMDRSPSRLLLYLGGISYSLYLVHLPLIDVVMGAAYKATGSSLPGALAAIVVTGGLAVGLAHLMRRWVEAPAMRWSERLKTVRLPRPRPAAARQDPADEVGAPAPPSGGRTVTPLAEQPTAVGLPDPLTD